MSPRTRPIGAASARSSTSGLVSNNSKIRPSDTRADASLLVSRSLRGKLQEAHALIYDDLEGEDVHRWVHRVKRLSDLGLEEEASELEQSLIELTRNDPELQKEFLHSLMTDAGRLAADPGVSN